tara:strand:+ start:1133 stop:1360 length:228 start_codon:yes stop_codon:yes gene_type:complete
MFEIIAKLRSQIEELDYPNSSFIIESCGNGTYRIIGIYPGGLGEVEQTGVISCNDVALMINAAKEIQGAFEGAKL